MDIKKGYSVCVSCSAVMPTRNFYKGRGEVVDNGTYSICKSCANRLGGISLENLHQILRILDIPFLPNIYYEARQKENPVSYYFTLINNPKKLHDNGIPMIDLRYSDSPTRDFVLSDDDIDPKEITKEELASFSRLRGLFGSNWSNKELLEMDEELDEMIVQYGGSREDFPTIDLYSHLVRLRWLSNKAYDEGDVKAGSEIMKSRNTLLSQNGMSLKDVRSKNQNDSLGTRIDMAEDRPIVPDKKYKDVDGIWQMFQYLIKHMERLIGVNKSSVDDDYHEMSAYVESQEKHYSEEME